MPVDRKKRIGPVVGQVAAKDRRAANQQDAGRAGRQGLLGLGIHDTHFHASQQAPTVPAFGVASADQPKRVKVKVAMTSVTRVFIFGSFRP